ncbi:unnamed protein product [Meganyctiphanes norvegica]|uniref:Secreted protein n=1 Tax=Meganyctiphanes norvegica TaxID=48144 RepID=A0AAV2RJQ9_MEGNR
MVLEPWLCMSAVCLAPYINCKKLLGSAASLSDSNLVLCKPSCCVFFFLGGLVPTSTLAFRLRPEMCSPPNSIMKLKVPLSKLSPYFRLNSHKKGGTFLFRDFSLHDHCL